MKPETALEASTGALVKASPALLAGVSLLALTGAGLAERLDAESSNPAFLIRRHQTCLACGRRRCSCGPAAPPRSERRQPAAPDAAPVERAAQLNSRDELLAALRLEIHAGLHEAAALVVGQIDRHGLLPQEARAELEEAGLDPATLACLLSTLRTVGPPGIGARDSIEALLLQLDSSALSPVQRELARRLLTSARLQIEHGDLPGAAEVIGGSVEAVQDVLAAIRRHLTPFPGLGDAESPTALPTAPRDEPDIYLNRVAGRIEVVLRERQQLTLSVDPSYRELMDRARALERRAAPRRAAGAMEFADAVEHASAAHVLVTQVHRRWRTIDRVAGEAVGRHEPMLLAESLAFATLTQAEVACRLQVHESTVSRAVRGRFVRLPWGEIVPLRRFFGAHHATKDALLDLLRAHERVSDHVLVEQLAARGHVLARRTVAKYRAELAGSRRR